MNSNIWLTNNLTNLCTKNLDFRRLDSNIIIILGIGILMSVGTFPEYSSQRILAGTMKNFPITCGKRFFRSVASYPHNKETPPHEHIMIRGDFLSRQIRRIGATYGPEDLHRVSITRFPLSRFSKGAGLLRNQLFTLSTQRLIRCSNLRIQIFDFQIFKSSIFKSGGRFP